VILSLANNSKMKRTPKSNTGTTAQRRQQTTQATMATTTMSSTAADRNSTVAQRTTMASAHVRTVVPPVIVTVALVLVVMTMVVGGDMADAALFPEGRTVVRVAGRAGGTCNSCALEQRCRCGSLGLDGSLAFLRGGGSGDTNNGTHDGTTDETNINTNTINEHDNNDGNKQKHGTTITTKNKKILSPITRILQMKDQLIHDTTTTSTTTTTHPSTERTQLLAYLGGAARARAATATTAPPPTPSDRPTVTGGLTKRDWVGSHDGGHDGSDRYVAAGAVREKVEERTSLEEEEVEEEEEYFATGEGEYEYDYEYDEEVLLEDDGGGSADEYQGAFQLDVVEQEGQDSDGLRSTDLTGATSTQPTQYNQQMDSDEEQEALSDSSYLYQTAPTRNDKESVLTEHPDDEQVYSFTVEDLPDNSHRSETISVEEDISASSTYREQQRQPPSSFVEEGSPDTSQLFEPVPVEEATPISSDYANDEEIQPSSFVEDAVPDSYYVSETSPAEDAVSVFSDYTNEEDMRSLPLAPGALPEDPSHRFETDSTEERDDEPNDTATTSTIEVEISQYVSSGWWTTIDSITSLGLSTNHKTFRISQKIHSLRKTTASLTGMHGLISGKKHPPLSPTGTEPDADAGLVQINDKDLGTIRRRLVAIERARRRVDAEVGGEVEGAFCEDCHAEAAGDCVAGECGCGCNYRYG